MKAKTVAQVIAAEAGGKTRAERLSAMKDVFSAMYNRAIATGASLEDVVAGSKQFSAYNHRMPSGTESLVSLAEQAMKEVQTSGPTHKGTFYARSYATKNLPKGLSRIKTAVDDHVYYSDPKNRAIVTAAGVLRPTQQPATTVASAAPAAAPGGLLESFFSDPLGMKAQAAEMPGGGLMAAYAPEISQAEAAKTTAPSSSFPSRPAQVASNTGGLLSNEATTQRLEREAGMFQPGIAQSEPDVQRMEREAGMYQPSAPAMSPDQRISQAFNGTPNGAPGFDVSGGIMAGNRIGGIMGPDTSAGAPKQDEGMFGGLMSSVGGLLGKVGDAYGIFGPNAADASIDPSTYAPAQAAPAASGPTPGGLRDADRMQRERAATLDRAAQERAAGVPQADAVFHDLPDTEVAYTPPDEPGNLHIGGLRPGVAKTAAVPVGPEATVKGVSPQVTASIDPGLMGVAQSRLTPNMAQSMTPAAWDASFRSMQPPAPAMEDPTTIDTPTIADPNATPEDQTTIGDYPAAPDPSFSERNPRTARTLKDMAVKGLLGGPVAAAMAGIGGILGGRLGPGFDAGMPQSDRYSVGSGLTGINAALGGPRGATATSLSNPGMSVTSLGNGQSLRRSDKFGWTEVVGPDGSVVGIRYDDPDKKGIMGKVSKGIGGLMGGGYGISPGAQHAIDSGKGGLY